MFRLVLENYYKTKEGSVPKYILYNNKELTTDSNFLLIDEMSKVEEYFDYKTELADINKQLTDIGTKFVNSYTDFINELEELQKYRMDITTFIVRLENEFIIFKSTPEMMLNGKLEIHSVYIPENEQILNYISKLLIKKENSNFSIYTLTEKNNYTPFVNLYIFKVLLARQNIEAKGEELFRTFPVTSKSGKVREVTAPHDEIKATLQELNIFLQKVYDKRNEEFQFAYKKGKNVKNGAIIHKDNKYVYNIDLHHFFPSCKRELVVPYLKFLFDFGIDPDMIRDDFMDTILIDDGLFIGNPISGTLANVIISKPVYYLKNICKKYNISFSVYADDMSFSSEKFLVKDFVIGLFKEAFSKYKLDTYFTLSEDKLVGFSGNRRKITGVAINDKNQITVPRRYYRNIRTVLDHLNNGDTNVNVTKLRGQIAYATMIDDSGKIYNYLNKFPETVKKYNLCSDEKLEELKERFEVNK